MAWRKRRLFQRRERCQGIPVDGARRLLQHEQGAWCVFALCWHSPGVSAQKARAWCSLQAGFELLAAKKLLCGPVRVILPALAAIFLVEQSFHPPLSHMSRARPPFFRPFRPPFASFSDVAGPFSLHEFNSKAPFFLVKSL